MNSDAFERFETSRSGLLIPFAVFLIGALATVVAITTVNRLALQQLAIEQEKTQRLSDVITAPNVAAEEMDTRNPEPAENAARELERSENGDQATQEQGQATP